MVSWAVTGATRGIGFGYIDNLSADPNNQVFALIRSLSTAGPLQELAGKRKNVHIVVTDLYDIKKLGEAAAEVSKATGGSLDVLILNAGSAGPDTNVLPPTAFIGKEEALEKEINENVSFHPRLATQAITARKILTMHTDEEQHTQPHVRHQLVSRACP